jgi:hypothetical protein
MPGFSNAPGVLTVTNAVSLNGTTLINLNRTNSPNCGELVATNITYGGTLTVSNLGPVLHAGDSFKLFSAPTLAGTFTATNLPATDVGGIVYTWTDNLSGNGTITLVSVVSTTPTNITFAVSGPNLVLSWPADHKGWRLLVQTNNLQAGISLNTNDWTTVVGSAATNQLFIPIDHAKLTEFYRMVYP